MKLHEFAKSTVAQAIVRTIYPYGSVRTIRRGPLKDKRMVVSPGMGYTFIWSLQGHEWDWLRLVGRGECVYDVGANCGQSTLHLANAVGPGGRVVAFEPTPDGYKSLLQNLELNGLDNVTPVCAAVAEGEGAATFRFDRQRPTMGRLSAVDSDLGPADVLEVRLVALDDYEQKGWPAPSFMKVDVEGGAPGVFKGAARLLAKCRPVIYVELHSLQEREAVRDLLVSHAYRAYTMNDEPVDDPVAADITPLVCRPI